MVFEYIELIKKSGPQEWIYRECQKLAKISFDFKEKIAPATYASKVAAAMQHYPSKEILSGPHLL
jgi:insulysin